MDALRLHFRSLLALAISVAALALIATAASASQGGDRNNDRIPDKWEKKNGLSLKANQARKDPDHDGLKNMGEFRAGTDPTNPDTDDDGVNDGDENAGVVKSFDGEALTIKLFKGGKLSGAVTEDTDVICDGEYEDEDGAGAAQSRPGLGEPGPDDGETGEYEDCTEENLERGTIVGQASIEDGEFEEVALQLAD